LLNKVPDQSTTDNPMVEKQTIQKFIENLKSQSRNILGTFHIKSYLGMESLPFLSDHAAWQEMLSEPY
jgi:hypothetical protein